MVPDSWLSRVYESQLALNFRNGSKLILAGADYADGLRGQSAAAIVADEHSYVANLQEMWEGALLPMLGTTKGWVMFISTPAGGGNFSTELWDRARNTMDPILWRQEFEASIESLLGAVYPDFGRINIRETRFNPQERLLFGVDFNRTPFCDCVRQVQGDSVAILNEYVLIDAETEAMASAVRRDFHHYEILACPDPTGRRLQTSSAESASMVRRGWVCFPATRITVKVMPFGSLPTP